MRNIFIYTNYRLILRDFYDERKRDNRKFSYSVFATQAGFKTKSYLIEVISAKKALSAKSVLKVAKAMKLKKKETEFLRPW